MAPNIPQSGTAGRHVWYTGGDCGSSPHIRSFSFSVLATGGSHDVEADHGYDGRIGLLGAAARSAGARGDAGQRDDAHGPSGRPELFHYKRGVGRGAQGVRAGVRQGGRAARHPVERRDDLRAGERQAGGSPELEARAVRGGQGEGDGYASHGERAAHHRDQDGRGRNLMRRALGAGLLAAALVACGSPAPSGLTLLFFRRSPAASLGGLSWAPDPDNSRLVAFDARLRVARSVTSARLANPMAVAALGTELLVTERTGEGLVLDTTGRPVREWESPNLASLYAAGGGADRSVYFAPLVRDEIRKYSAGGALRWTAKRGLFRSEADPEFLPPKGRDIGVRKALVNVALALGPDGRLYALGSDDSGATKLRVDVIDTARGAILATRHLGARETAVAVDARGRLALFDADSLVAGLAQREREPFTPGFALPDVEGDTVTLARFAGKVTLVNFWASWCDPCREEFPHMAELYREFARKDFEIAAISDDVDRGKMLAFVRQFRPPFPILVGGGRMKQTYHYRGLPYSVLLDRRGRVIERIFGF